MFLRCQNLQQFGKVELGRNWFVNAPLFSLVCVALKFSIVYTILYCVRQILSYQKLTFIKIQKKKVFRKPKKGMDIWVHTLYYTLNNKKK